MITDDRAVLFHAAVASDLLDALLDARLAGSGLAPRAFEVATALSTRGPLSPGELALVTGVPAASMSRIVAGLERDGFVVVAPHATDRRSRVVTLTKGGRAAFRRAAAAFTPLVDEIIAALGSSAAPVAWAVRRLESALRVVGDTAAVAPLSDPGQHAVYYAGERLHPDEEAELLAYLDWLRARRSAIKAPRSVASDRGAGRRPGDGMRKRGSRATGV